MNKKYIISGGGTGGHIFPAIAIANAIKKDNSQSEILFVGAIGKMEMQKVPEAGYAIKGLPIAGLQRSLSIKNLLLPIKIVQSVVQAVGIINAYKPNVVIGVGGYASAPLLLAAIIKNIPFIIQEQNSYAGITNKILGRWAQHICVAYKGMELFFNSKKLVYTGNPVRAIITHALPSKNDALQYFGLDSTKQTLLIVGGSLGARTINQSVDNGLQTLVGNNVQIIWQTGKGYLEQAHQSINNLMVTMSENQPTITVDETGNSRKIETPYIKCYDFIARMDMAYAAADVVISRAGALSVSELCIVGKPTILVPSPNVAEDHQTKNAMALLKIGATLMVKDAEAHQQLIPTALDLFNNNNKQQQLATAIKTLAINNADSRILEVIKQLINN